MVWYNSIQSYTKGEDMDDKMLRISGDLHKRVKLAATMHDVSIKEWVEKVLEYGLAAEGMTLVDPGTDYTTKGENNA